MTPDQEGDTLPVEDRVTRRARAVEGLLGIALISLSLAFVDWRLGVAAAGVLFYVSALWGKA